MIQWGNPDMAIISQHLRRQTKKDELCESQIQLNRQLRTSLTHDSERNNKAIIHNHFNIIINVGQNTSEEKITSIVQQLTTIVSRVN
jgi:hypothetical protein